MVTRIQTRGCFINPNQSAFIKGRLLMENVLLASELVKDYHKETISPRCALKIDISKAFDSVQWDFLLNILSVMDLPPKFIQWIKICITSPSFSIQVNGELAGYFQNERGLRQGCSLSPYLFVMCMNVLSLMLDKAAADGKFGYHPGCRKLRLTHLCFADDIIVFTEGKQRSLEGILDVFREFASASGLTISLEKSTLFMAGISTRSRTSITATFPFSIGTLPVRYLGLPLMTKRMTLADCLPLLEKFRTRISSWKHRLLSYAGRLQLLTSVIASITNFWISAFRLPSACVKELEKISSAFLWSGPSLNTKKAKISWKEICRPKQEGGLGVKSIVDANKVSCFKLIWRIVSGHNSLWVNWIQRFIIRSGSFWSEKVNSHSGSWMWRKILKYRSQAKEFTKMEVKCGQQTSLWFDRWSTKGCLHDTLGNRGFIDFGLPASATINDAVFTNRRRRHRLAFMNEIELELDAIRDRGLCQETDVALWRGKGNRFKAKFSSKETWNQIRDRVHITNWHACVWFKHATPRYSFMMWLAVKNRLSTGDRMSSWSGNINTTCVLCQHPTETRDHLFYTCVFSTQIWEQLTKKLLGHHYTNSFEAMIGIMSDNTLETTQRFVVRYAFQATMHIIWRERNRRRHGELPMHPEKVIKQIDRIVLNRLSSITTEVTRGLQIWFSTR